jgi:hypothetical protein
VAGQSLSKFTRADPTERRVRPFTDAEVATLLAGDADLEMADAIRVAALSGMRLDELYRLTVADCAGGWFDLRRWFVTKARGAGFDPAVVAAIVGHEVGNITDDVCSSGPDDELKRRCVEAVRLPETAGAATHQWLFHSSRYQVFRPGIWWMRVEDESFRL